MVLLSRLAKMKEWLTVSEAARYLGRATNDDATEADIFALAVSRRLTLSARFLAPTLAVELPGSIWKRIVMGDREFDLFDEPCAERAYLPDGTYDWPMLGLERFDIEHEYRRRTGGPRVAAPRRAKPADGPFAKSCSSSSVFQLLTPGDSWSSRPYRSGRYLPRSTSFVVRPQALEALLEQAPPRTTDVPTFREDALTPDWIGGPRLAAWLRAEMEQRNITVHRLHTLTRMDRKTILKVLNGERVRAPFRRKLAGGLSLEGPSVLVDDVPSD